MKIRYDCPTCNIYFDLPLEQFKKQKDGGLFIGNLGCPNCGTACKLDLMFGDK